MKLWDNFSDYIEFLMELFEERRWWKLAGTSCCLSCLYFLQELLLVGFYTFYLLTGKRLRRLSAEFV